MLTGQLALIISAMFSGAALYINFAEQTARLGLGNQSLLDEWKPSYKRGFVMQATLAIIGFVLGAFSWWQSRELIWLIGGIIILMNWPYTLLIVMPTNRRLMATDIATHETRELIIKWGHLHVVRTILGFASTAIFLLALL